VMEKNLKTYRRAIKALSRTGLVMSISDAAHSKGAAGDDGADA
jgi:hypothetical protein